MTDLQIGVLARDDEGNVVSDTITVNVADAPPDAPASAPPGTGSSFPGPDVAASGALAVNPGEGVQAAPATPAPGPAPEAGSG
jgi:hypothetical protein